MTISIQFINIYELHLHKYNKKHKTNILSSHEDFLSFLDIHLEEIIELVKEFYMKTYKPCLFDGSDIDPNCFSLELVEKKLNQSIFYFVNNDIYPPERYDE